MWPSLEVDGWQVLSVLLASELPNSQCSIAGGQAAIREGAFLSFNMSLVVKNLMYHCTSWSVLYMAVCRLGLGIHNIALFCASYGCVDVTFYVDEPWSCGDYEEGYAWVTRGWPAFCGHLCVAFVQLSNYACMHVQWYLFYPDPPSTFCALLRCSWLRVQPIFCC